MEPSVENWNSSQNEEENEIDLLELAGVLVQKIWIVLLAAIVVAGFVWVYNKTMVTPKYESYATLYILSKQNENSTITSQDISASTSLLNDFREAVTSRNVLEKTIADLHLENVYTYQVLAGHVSVTIADNSRMLRITVLDEDPRRAKEIVDKVADQTSTLAIELMELSVNVIDEGMVPEAPSSPNTKRNTILGALVGAVLACAVIVIQFMMDDTLKADNDVEKHLGLTVLASIPLQEGETSAKEMKRIDRQGRKMQNKQTSRRG